MCLQKKQVNLSYKILTWRTVWDELEKYRFFNLDLKVKSEIVISYWVEGYSTVLHSYTKKTFRSLLGLGKPIAVK